MPDDRIPPRVAVDQIASTAVPDLAAKLADLHGLGSVIVSGWQAWKPQSYPQLRTIQLGPIEGPPGVPSLAHEVDVPTATSALVVDIPAALAANPGVASDLADLIDNVPLVLLRLADPMSEAMRDALDARGRPTSFVGQTKLDDGEPGTLVVLDQAVADAATIEPPEGFRVLAVLTTFNEEDLIASTIEALLQDQVEIRIVDNWSTDSTYAIATGYAERGLLNLERFPAEPVATFNHGELLRRIEEIADEAGGAWVIHHDTDERRRSPWPGITMRRALWTVDRAGFNAVNHTVLTFRPVDDGWRPGVDPEGYFRFFELEPRPDLLLQVRAWRATSKVDLASTGGHEARFEGRRVFPYHFLLKHYPLRSQEQAERKIFRERRARWNKDERAKGWHHHYDEFQAGESFIWPRDQLDEFVDSRSSAEFLIPFVGGVEVGQPWAAKARITAVENELLGQQTLQVQRRLERLLGPGPAAWAVNQMRSVAWIVRPFRRAAARRRWRRSGIDASDRVV